MSCATLTGNSSSRLLFHFVAGQRRLYFRHWLRLSPNLSPFNVSTFLTLLTSLPSKSPGLFSAMDRIAFVLQQDESGADTQTYEDVVPPKRRGEGEGGQEKIVRC